MNSDTFTDSLRTLCLDSTPPPAALFALRYDYATTAQGRIGGLPLQSTEWTALVAQTWEAAKVEARALVARIPAVRFDRSAPEHLQGCCLVELAAAPFRTLAFRFA